MTITQTIPACDLSYYAILDAVEKLPAAKIYRLQVSVEELLYAAQILRELLADVANKPLSPYISLEGVPLARNYSWALWADGHCVWSPGA